jgi:hypothetical protein
MLKEYCDSCGKQIETNTTEKVPGEDFLKDTRIVISVVASSRAMPKPGDADNFEVSSDVLCPDCARKWKFEE